MLLDWVRSSASRPYWMLFRSSCRTASCRPIAEWMVWVFQQATGTPGDAVFSFFNKTSSELSGAVSLPLAGPCGGMDAATEPPWTDSRRVPRAVRAPRTRGLRVCCRALARPPSRDTLQVRPCKLLGSIHAAKGPATVSGQGPVTMVGAHSFQSNHQRTVWCGVLTACGTVWRHGCRHRASMDGFTACPASGKGTAPSTLHISAGPLPAHHRRTCSKYVPVRSVAASMPPRVPRRWAGKDQAS